MRGEPDAVLIARDLQDVQEALRVCSAEKIPVTFCGSQTSMTGASVALGGLLVSTEKLDKVLDVGKAQPGVTITEFKKAFEPEGLFYPPAPTSQDDARLGATVSTNATGEDSFQYGTTRRYVRELKVLLADGTKKGLSRKPDETLPDEPGRAGYLAESKNPIDLLIGGEGTLGFIYEVTVDLVPLPPGTFAALAPFPDVMRAVDLVVRVVREGKLKPRALELIDPGALAVMRRHSTFPQSLAEADTLIYFKHEFKDEAELAKLLPQWFATGLAETTLIATTDKQKEAMRQWRHFIPSQVNEEYRRYWKQGGGKVGSDWWVPIPRLKEMMVYVYQTGAALDLPFMAYAHIGRGHPHVNYLCKTAEEKQKGHRALLQCCRKAVALGGGVAGEHGIGKLHRDLMPIQWPAEQLARMRRIKQEWDPNWILGRGNIIEKT